MAPKSGNSPVVVILGPTASGKSDLGLRLAKQYNGEIIAADSRTIYKGMDIGTTKPSASDRAIVPHHLIDVTTPNEPLTVADFKRMAGPAVDEIASRGRLPFIVGGTALYIDA